MQNLKELEDRGAGTVWSGRTGGGYPPGSSYECESKGVVKQCSVEVIENKRRATAIQRTGEALKTAQNREFLLSGMTTGEGGKRARDLLGPRGAGTWRLERTQRDCAQVTKLA
jgi:hypothetical protein